MKFSPRERHFLCAILVLLCGLGARKFGSHLPPFLADYAPDALWALMVFFLVTMLKPNWPVWKIGGVALLFAYAIELSQLYQAEWINAVRDTKLGGLVLGHGFLASDLICYTVGVAFCVLLEKFCSDRRKIA